MGVRENKNTVVQYQAAVTAYLQQGAADAFTAFLHEEVVWHLPQSMAAFGGSEFRGHAGVKAMLTDNFHRFYQPQSIQVQFRSMIGEGEYVHMHFAMSALTVNGNSYQNDYQVLYQLQDEKIRNVWEYFDAHRLIVCMQ